MTSFMIKTSIRFFLFICIVFLTAGTFSLADASGTGAVKQVVFEKADYLLQETDTHKTRLYAPKTFEKAMEFYKKADKAYDEGKSLDDINENLNEAISNFSKALELCKKGTDIFYETQSARDSAIKVRASKYRPAEWTTAESMFNSAVSRLEKGDIDEAKAMAGETETLFRIAELTTIKLSYLGLVWKKLEKMETMKGEDYFPAKTYQKASDLAIKAEFEIERQRYGNDRAKKLVEEASEQAEYGMKIAEFIKHMIKNDKTYEDLIIRADIPLDLSWTDPQPTHVSYEDETTSSTQ